MVDDGEWPDEEPSNFFRGLRNGCLVSIPMWALIVYALYLTAGCGEHAHAWG